jgi:hypothetical protein
MVMAVVMVVVVVMVMVMVTHLNREMRVKVCLELLVIHLRA